MITTELDEASNTYHFKVRLQAQYSVAAEYWESAEQAGASLEPFVRKTLASILRDQVNSIDIGQPESQPKYSIKSKISPEVKESIELLEQMKYADMPKLATGGTVDWPAKGEQAAKDYAKMQTSILADYGVPETIHPAPKKFQSNSDVLKEYFEDMPLGSMGCDLCNDKPTTLFKLVMHLNDFHKLSRERIATYLEDNDINPERKQNVSSKDTPSNPATQGSIGNFLGIDIG